MIQDFICNVCDILDIAQPTVSYDTSDFPTDTMLAQVNTEGSVIYLKRYENPNPDQLFAIAHELRHIWQMINDKQIYLHEYKPIELCQSIEEYNLQIAEIDANAFASIIMISLFHIKPQFTGLSETVITQINERIEYLKGNL